LTGFADSDMLEVARRSGHDERSRGRADVKQQSGVGD
jgi:hypothetical protein